MAKSNILGLLSNRFISKKAQNAKLLTPENVLPEGPARQRHAAEAPLPFLGDGKVQARHNPGRRALKEIEFADAGSDLRDELDGACAGTNNGDISSGEIYVVIPSCGMKRRTFEAVDALDIRIARNVQSAHSGDKHAGAHAHSVGCRGIPDLFGFIPNRFSKTSIEAQIRSKSVMLDTTFEVVVDFLLARVHAGPFR